MVAGLAQGLSHRDAARFSFLLATPVILAAGVLKIPDLFGPLGAGIHGQILAGSVAAFVAAGYFGCRTRPAPVQTAAPASTSVGSTPLAALGGKGDTVTLPPLDASDTIVRTLVQALTERRGDASGDGATGLRHCIFRCSQAMYSASSIHIVERPC